MTSTGLHSTATPLPAPSTAPTAPTAPTTDIQSFPPFYTLQPNPQTRMSQLHSWSRVLQSHFRSTHTFSTTLTPTALAAPPFANPALRRGLSTADAKAVLEWMAGPDGGRRAERVGKDADGAWWVYWRRPEEWAEMVWNWVEETAQRGVVFTLFELGEGDAVRGQEFYGLDPELLKKSLGVLVKQGKAQIFGSDDSPGVKFF